MGDVTAISYAWPWWEYLIVFIDFVTRFLQRISDSFHR